MLDQVPLRSIRLRRLLPHARLGAIALVFLAAFLTMSWSMYREFRSLLIDQGIQLAEQFAHASRPVFVVNNLTAIKQTASVFQGFPGVHYLGVVDRDFRLRYKDGVPSIHAKQGYGGLWPEHGMLAAEDERLWHFVAPIKLADNDASSPYVERTRPRREVVGYVQLEIDKERLRRLAVVLVPINAAIGVVLSFLLLIWAKKETLRGHADVLESEVQIRTQDALAARDAALTADRHKSEFLATVTHEMRTPLNSIIGYTQLALERLEHCQDNRNKNDLTVVLKSGVQLLALINNILDTTALEAGKIDVRLEAVNLPELVASAIATLRPLVLKNSNELKHEMSGDEMITVDKAKLRQILLNLLTNAAKFTQRGHITLKVENTAAQLRIEVTDSGIGIPEDQQALIFEPFRKIEIDNAHSYQGTGLGLAISQAFCRLMGGSITVKSSVNAGARFTVTILLPIRFKGDRHIDDARVSCSGGP